MGVKTTYNITRELAIQAILAKVYSAGEKELEEILENLIDNPFQNYQIVNELDKDDWHNIEHIAQLL